MVESPGAVIAGALLAGCSTGAKEIIVCIEDNKPDAVKEMRMAARATRIKIAALKTKYPQGSERHMIMAIIKRIMPLGRLPGDVGVAVSNVGTAAAVAGAVLRGKPLTHRIVCVTGEGIVNPKNLLVPMGIRYGDLIEYCGGFTKDAARVVSGGPMMGFSFSDFDMPVTKGTGGITVLTKEDVNREKETSCIRCGRCVDVCPMHLVPTRLALASRHGNMEMAEKYNIMGCMESGCCAYICPANIPLVQLIRTGKAMLAAKGKTP
jgi:electron transport complex protein RnfC